MKKRLILNADDFGLTRGVNEAIVRAHRDGVLTSATLMANGPAFEHAVELAKANPSLGVGCHLVLVGGVCVASPREIPSLADREGNLPASLGALVARLSSGKIRSADIERELRAQVEKIIAAGIGPTHFDTHKHTHVHPRVLDALGRVAQDFSVHRIRKPIERLRRSWASRAAGAKQIFAATAVHAIAPKFHALLKKYSLRSPDHFLGLALTGKLGSDALLSLIETLPDGCTEIMFHPGICDADLARTGSRLQCERELELHALLDPAIRQAIASRDIALISYRDLY